MRSIHHLVLSVLAGFSVVLVVDAAVDPIVLVGVAIVVGVGIDVDHFPIARYNAGSWRALRGCLGDPRRVFLAQDEIFQPGEVWPLQRLLSHVALAGALVVVVAAGSDTFALVVTVSLYVHVLADLAWDVARQDQYFEQVREST